MTTLPDSPITRALNAQLEHLLGVGVSKPREKSQSDSHKESEKDSHKENAR